MHHRAVRAIVPVALSAGVYSSPDDAGAHTRAVLRSVSVATWTDLDRRYQYFLDNTDLRERTLNPAIARAKAETLLEWAAAIEREPEDGSTEAVFLLRRAAKQISAMAGLGMQIEAHEKVVEPSIEETRPG